MIRAGIIGGTGYTAAELLRVLVFHPHVSISWVYSQSESGAHISDVHLDLEGLIDLQFTDQISWDVDVIFLCLPHGISKQFLQDNPVPGGVKVIDLSRDFRLEEGKESDFIYGLPEINKSKIENALKVANPGCFATSIQLAIAPLIDANLISDTIHITAMTGSTGAGKKPLATTHFSWRSSNISVYKPFVHQHLDEIHHNMDHAYPGFDQEMIFIPMRGNYPRGILTSMYTKCDKDTDEVLKLYKTFYLDAPFTYITEQNLDLKQVVNTNKAKLSVHTHAGYIHVQCAIDNLLKGASGQAVQNMNLMFGLEETAGLHLKSIGY